MWLRMLYCSDWDVIRKRTALPPTCQDTPGVPRSRTRPIPGVITQFDHGDRYDHGHDPYPQFTWVSSTMQRQRASPGVHIKALAALRAVRRWICVVKEWTVCTVPSRPCGTLAQPPAAAASRCATSTPVSSSSASSSTSAGSSRELWAALSTYHSSASSMATVRLDGNDSEDTLPSEVIRSESVSQSLSVAHPEAGPPAPAFVPSATQVSGAPRSRESKANCFKGWLVRLWRRRSRAVPHVRPLAEDQRRPIE